MSDKSEFIFELQKVEKKLNGKMILKIPSFKLESGKIHAIVGPNGAGKTTLLKLLALLDSPSKGQILFQGKRVSSSNSFKFRRRVTLVMQDHFLFDSSVYKNVSYGLRKRGEKRRVIKEKVYDVLSLVGLENFEDRHAKNLSGGEGKRLGIARAIVLEPEVILLDEPTANVDEENSELIEKIMKDINTKNGSTIVLTTHNIQQAHHLAHKTTSLNKGELSR